MLKFIKISQFLCVTGREFFWGLVNEKKKKSPFMVTKAAFIW